MPMSSTTNRRRQYTAAFRSGFSRRNVLVLVLMLMRRVCKSRAALAFSPAVPRPAAFAQVDALPRLFLALGKGAVRLC